LLARNELTEKVKSIKMHQIFSAGAVKRILNMYGVLKYY
jgi:hypothetical protein